MCEKKNGGVFLSCHRYLRFQNPLIVKSSSAYVVKVQHYLTQYFFYLNCDTYKYLKL